ncbi:unnamed protein product, partial [Coregonus sp. 'balchen']
MVSAARPDLQVCSLKEAKIAKICPVASMTATTRGSPVGGNDNQAGQAPDAQSQSQPPLPQNQTSSPNSTNENSPRCIINNTHRLVELCVAKLSQDWFPLLELLAMATNPHCKFHIYNGTRPSETVPAGAQLADDELFARPPDPRSPKVGSEFK